MEFIDKNTLKLDKIPNELDFQIIEEYKTLLKNEKA